MSTQLYSGVQNKLAYGRTVTGHTGTSPTYYCVTSSYSSAYTFATEVLLNSQDVSTISSNVTINLYGKGNSFSFSSVSNSYYIKVSTDGGATYPYSYSGTCSAISTTRSLIGSYTLDVPHNSQTGELNSLAIQVYFQGRANKPSDYRWDFTSWTYQGVTYYTNGDKLPISVALPRTLTWDISSIDITQPPTISTKCTVSASPELLTNGDDLSIIVTRTDPSSTHSVYYTIGSSTTTLLNQGTTTSFIIPWNTLSSLVPYHSTADCVVEVETFLNGTSIGSNQKTVRIQNGQTPLSLYDDLDGDIGVTIGETASEGGFNCLLPARFIIDNTLQLPLAEYVVETGASGIWSYVKYSSGRVELWGTTSDECRSGTLQTQSLPFNMQTTYNVQMTANAPGFNNYANRHSCALKLRYANQFTWFYTCSAGTTSGYTSYVDFHIVGFLS